MFEGVAGMAAFLDGHEVAWFDILQEGDADLFLASPFNMAWTLNVVAIDKEREFVWNAEWTRDAKACAADRQVSDGARDPGGSIECNRARFQEA